MSSEIPGQGWRTPLSRLCYAVIVVNYNDLVSNYYQRYYNSKAREIVSGLSVINSKSKPLLTINEQTQQRPFYNKQYTQSAFKHIKIPVYEVNNSLRLTDDTIDVFNNPTAKYVRVSSPTKRQ